MAAKKLSFEEKLSRLEEIVAALEKGDAPLADSLRLFEEGTKLVNACSTELDKAEQQVVKLMKGPDARRWSCPLKVRRIDMEKTAFDARYQEYLAAIEDYLNSLFAEKPHWADLYEPCGTAFSPAASGCVRR